MRKISTLRKIRFIASNPVIAATAFYIKHFNPAMFPGSVFDPNYNYDGIATCIDPKDEEARRTEWYNSVTMYMII